MSPTKAGVMADEGMLGRDDRFSLELPPDPASIRTARLFAAAIARHFGAGEDTVEDVKLAVSEACTNAVKAHKEADISEPVEVRATVIADRLLFEVIDAGRGFAPPAVDGAMTPPDGLYEGSLGLTVIRALFDDAEIAPNTDRGMTMRFSLPARQAESLED